MLSRLRSNNNGNSEEMEFISTPLPGCWEIQPRVFSDHRGRFVKTYVEDELASRGLATHFPEEYYSVSRKGVLRGMHFQRPPHAHSKLVYCTAGRVLDVVVDLRAGSPAYSRVHAVILSAEQGNMLYIPEGFAHGFLALEDATMQYKVTSVHAPSHDDGILWNSIAFHWPQSNAVLSERDQKFPSMHDFSSPFVYERMQ